MPCKQTVKVTYDKKGNVVKMELNCQGTCDDDGTKCKKVEVPIGLTGSTRAFCACKEGKGDEPWDCHIVLYTYKDDKGRVTYQFTCENRNPCPNKDVKLVCGPKPLDFPTEPDKIETLEFECGCVEESEVWHPK